MKTINVLQGCGDLIIPLTDFYGRTLHNALTLLLQCIYTALMCSVLIKAQFSNQLTNYHNVTLYVG